MYASVCDVGSCVSPVQRGERVTTRVTRIGLGHAMMTLMRLMLQSVTAKTNVRRYVRCGGNEHRRHGM